jgi:N-acetylmuramoyl-L-alanine amidase
VIHYTAMRSATAARDWLCNPEAQVSAHYVIAEDGRIWQLVDEDMRAWHAGAGQWGSCTDVNSHSIGIELANTGSHPFPEPQMAVLETLLSGIFQRRGIRPEGVIGHSDMAPGRKIDPGPKFDWRRLARKGLAIWPEPATDAPFPTQEALAKAGYTAPTAPEIRLAAFRSRFLPHLSGPECAEDRACANALACAFPVDRPAPSA